MSGAFCFCDQQNRNYFHIMYGRPKKVAKNQKRIVMRSARFLRIFVPAIVSHGQNDL